MTADVYTITAQYISTYGDERNDLLRVAGFCTRSQFSTAGRGREVYGKEEVEEEGLWLWCGEAGSPPRFYSEVP